MKQNRRFKTKGYRTHNFQLIRKVSVLLFFIILLFATLKVKRHVFHRNVIIESRYVSTYIKIISYAVYRLLARIQLETLIKKFINY